MDIQWTDTQDGLKILIGVLFWIALIILISIIFIQTINQDFEFFEYKRVQKETLKKLIIRDEEGGIEYYHLLGRLLVEDNNKHIGCIRDLYPYLNGYIENKNLYPIWKGTTQQKRDKTLDAILK